MKLRNRDKNVPALRCYLHQGISCVPWGDGSKGCSAYSTYVSWAAMMTRCYEPRWYGYHNYGGAGIVVFQEWHDFLRFVAAIGLRPTPGHTLDRFPNQRGSYEPGNVRWATSREQGNNRRTNIVLDYQGQRMTAIEWERKLGLPRLIVASRIRRGWTDPEKILSADNFSVKALTANGETHTIREWADISGVSYGALKWRLQSGWPLERAIGVRVGLAHAISHDGKEMKMADWAHHLGLSYKALQWRIAQGWPIERILSPRKRK